MILEIGEQHMTTEINKTVELILSLPEFFSCQTLLQVQQSPYDGNYPRCASEWKLNEEITSLYTSTLANSLIQGGEKYY